MMGLDNLLQLPGQYVSTVFDFLFRPGRFARNHNDDKSVYLNAHTFLLTNIGIAAAVAVSVAAAEPDGISNLEATGTFAIMAVIHCLLALACGSLSAWLLNESVEALDLVAAFCYSSIFYPGIALVIGLADEWEIAPAGWAVLSLTVLQILAVAYLLPTMSRFSSLFGRRLLSFVTVATALELFGVIALTSVAIVVMIRAQRMGREGERVHGDAYLRLTSTGTPIGSITLEARELGPNSAQLVGASIGGKNQEWFDFGDTRDMKLRIDARNGVGTAMKLMPETRYYFRYVVRGDQITCIGNTGSFVTPAP